MLSLGKLGPGQQQYYLDAVARGAEEYYTNAREAPGQWVGAGSGLLGLSGEVDGEVLGRVLDNQHPTEAWRLTGSKSAPVVAGFDVTFCAPKSVSLLFALGSPEVSNEVRNAADAAIAASFPVLEREACRVRRGKEGRVVLAADGFTAAAFRHRTSRAADPHLHTHVVIANVARGCDGRWSALDGRPLYSWLAPVGYLYEAHLRYELTRRLGVTWGPVKNGIADVDGISEEVRREFSTRRKEIEVHLEEHGQVSARAAQYATYATRKTKDRGLDATDLQEWWWDRARGVGLDPAGLATVTGRARSAEPPALGTADAEELYGWLASPEGLTRHASTFGRRDVIKAVCNALPAGGRVDQVLDLVEGFLASEHVLALGVQRGGACIRRDDGTVIAARTDDQPYTTPEMIQIETRLLEGAGRRRHSGVGLAHPSAVDGALGARPTLTREQAAMVRAVCSSGDGVEVVDGVAGAGKTFALDAARDAWQASGHEVIGCALAARAAEGLHAGAGIDSVTVDRLLANIETGRRRLGARSVIVADEAAMIGTRQLARLLDHAEAAGAKVVLVGDPFQLPEIEAGGAFRGLQERLGATRLTANRRQTHPWERAALAELRHGDPDRAVDAYLAHNRVHHTATTHKAREALVQEWMNARADGHDALIVAARLSDVDDLNHRARRLLHDEGHLGVDRVVLDGRPYADGDHVLALRNDYRLGILNGTRATIDRVDLDHRTLHVRDDHGQRLVIPFDYATAGHLAHGYATTIHKAQGATVDRCLVLADDTATRELAYTALSRGRHGNDIYIVSDDRRVEERHAAELDPDPLQALRNAVSRRADKHLAIDSPGTGRDLGALRRERDALRARLDVGAPPAPGVNHRYLAIDRRRIQDQLRDAQWRAGIARADLAKLGPIRRRTRPAGRRDLEARLESCTTDIRRHQTALRHIDRQLHELAPIAERRARWEHDHRDDLAKLQSLDQAITLAERLEQVTARTLQRGPSRGRGIEL